MTDTENLAALADAVEAGRDNSELWYPALSDCGGTAMMAFHGDLNAAVRLVEAMLPGWAVENLGQVCIDGTGGWRAFIVAPDYVETFAKGDATAHNPARALLLATLRAKASE